MNEKYRKIAYIVIPLLVIILLLGVLYQNGYRITPNFKIVKTGTLKLNISLDNPVVFISNEEQETKTALDGSYLVEKITPGAVSVIVSKEGYWPWTKDVIIDEERITELDTFLVPRNPIKRIIQKNTEEFRNISRELAIPRNPSTANKLVSESGNVSVWVEGKTIKAEWRGNGNAPYYFCEVLISSTNKECPKTTDVITLLETPTNIFFKQGSDNILIFTRGASVYAVEIHHYGLQNFQPIYTGIKPVIRYVNKTLYIKDGEIMAEVSL